MKKITYLFIGFLLFTGIVYGQNNPKKILFFGDSITAGYGLEEEQAFPALVQEKIDSLGWNFEAVNAGLSGETSAGGLRRVDWMLRQDFSIFVLELGGNDGLRGIDLESTKQNLISIIEKVRDKKPEAKIILTGMQVPPNLGPDYTTEFREMYPEIAEEKNVTLIPFLLEEVGGNPELNQADGIHPTAKGHEIIAETVWDTLKPILRGLRA
ncbi:arylesterase [Balneolaceae bacterium YR4-1]|uniref:Arylesterase n=1 Tax=Halalkalibaculum roseum TaxID=2709311 RepID=A0A6M1SXZ5_9BACT|nr:arylesterase [Halalkalibaculum roseum]NGP76014.1 arylesterase [Halalkalibaculum roseum]